jgi:hypothetical protein
MLMNVAGEAAAVEDGRRHAAHSFPVLLPIEALPRRREPITPVRSSGADGDRGATRRRQDGCERRVERHGEMLTRTRR